MARCVLGQCDRALGVFGDALMWLALAKYTVVTFFVIVGAILIIGGLIEHGGGYD